MILFSSGDTGRDQERHFDGVPRPLTIESTSVVDRGIATIIATLNASRATGYRVELARAPGGPALFSSGDQPFEGDGLTWVFEGVTSAAAAIWARVLYWTDSDKRHSTERQIALIALEPPITLGERWPLASAGLSWDDRLVWPGSGITQPAPGGETPTTPTTPTAPTTPTTTGLRWDDSLRWSDLQTWQE